MREVQVYEEVQQLQRAAPSGLIDWETSHYTGMCYKYLKQHDKWVTVSAAGGGCNIHALTELHGFRSSFQRRRHCHVVEVLLGYVRDYTNRGCSRSPSPKYNGLVTGSCRFLAHSLLPSAQICNCDILVFRARCLAACTCAPAQVDA
jgi:hypothetical protein